MLSRLFATTSYPRLLSIAMWAISLLYPASSYL
jgi:hypothetical protein